MTATGWQPGSTAEAPAGVLDERSANQRPLKILLSAYACHPNLGSEPGLGWNWLREIAKNHEVWILFYDGYGQREAVEQACSALPYRRHIHLHPIGVPRWLRTRAFRLRYEWWQYAAYRAAKALTEGIDFDVIHHATVSAWWNCGHLWKLPIPFIFGPISGAQQTPRAAYPFLRWQDRCAEMMRSTLFYVCWYGWRRPRRALQKAALVIAGNRAMESLVRRVRGDGPTALLCQIGMDRPRQTARKAPSTSQTPLRFLFAGQLVACKNFGLLLAALRLLPASRAWTLRVVGDGPLREYWSQKVAECGLSSRIQFLRQVDHSEMDELYSWADVFVFPSCRDSNATVTLEAIAHQLPIVALRIVGNTLILNDGNAMLIDIDRSGQIAGDFAAALERLCGNPELRVALGNRAHAWAAEEMTWPQQAARMEELYRRVLPSRAVAGEPCHAGPGVKAE